MQHPCLCPHTCAAGEQGWEKKGEQAGRQVYMLTIPYRAFRLFMHTQVRHMHTYIHTHTHRCISLSRVHVMRTPVQPNGCPSAMAPVMSYVYVDIERKRRRKRTDLRWRWDDFEECGEHLHSTHIGRRRLRWFRRDLYLPIYPHTHSRGLHTYTPKERQRKPKRKQRKEERERRKPE